MQDPEVVVNLIAHGTRRRILELLERSPRALSVDEVAAAIAVHRTVAATHLGHLAEAGLLEATDERRSRGRPRRRYRALSAADVSWPPRRHRQLALTLAAALAGMGAEGAAAARTAGRAFGRSLVRLEDLGAKYELAPDGIVHAQPCVFREVCLEAGPIVCLTHAAIIEGALDSACEPLGRESGGCAYQRVFSDSATVG